jgi:hypothetical protein
LTTTSNPCAPELGLNLEDNSERSFTTSTKRNNARALRDTNHFFSFFSLYPNFVIALVLNHEVHGANYLRADLQMYYTAVWKVAELAILLEPLAATFCTMFVVLVKPTEPWSGRFMLLFHGMNFIWLIHLTFGLVTFIWAWVG